MFHTPEWYSSLRDVSMLWQALGGAAIFSMNFPRRRLANLNFALFWILGAIALWFSRRQGLLFLNEGSNVYIVYFLTVTFAFSISRISVWTALMVGSSGFLAQQICGSLLLAFRSVPAVGAAIDYSNFIVVLDILFYSAGYYVIWRIYRNKSFSEIEDVTPLQMGVFSALALMLSLGFYTINQFVRGWESFSQIELTMNSLYVAVGSAFLLVMQYEFIRRQRLNSEVQGMKAMLRAQESQLHEGKERAELVNEKYHDLKKIINSFSGELDAGQLRKLSDAIEAYDDKVSTGSGAADVVLTEARELCRGKGIQFTCFVRGSDLDFMEELDIYSFLKNAVDNAVEAVDALPEGREKFISLTARSEGGIVTLHEENPCAGVIFEDGVPKSQRDPELHGFGMKSMMRIAGKYGGAVTASAKDGIFYLDAIFMPE